MVQGMLVLLLNPMVQGILLFHCSEVINEILGVHKSSKFQFFLFFFLIIYVHA